MKIKKIVMEEETQIRKEERIIFHKFQRMKKHHQALFALVIAIGVVFVWRGLWNFIDYYWFPGWQNFSNISGVVAGVIILILSHKAINQLAGN